MASELQIRPANCDDLKDLLPLLIELNPDDKQLSMDVAKTLLDKTHAIDGSTILIGLVNGKVASTCTVIVIPNLSRNGRPYALIENVVTAARFRKRGFGEAVIKHAIQHAWKHDCYKTMLMTGSKDPGTLKFYSRCGLSANKTGFQIRNGIDANDRVSR